MKSTLNNKIEKYTWFDKNPIKTALIFTILAVFIVLIGAEYVLEKKFKIQSDTKQRYVNIREVLPNTDTIGASDNPNKPFVRVRTDENGLVKPGRIYDKAEITLFFIGSSPIMAITLDEDERVPYVSGRLLEQKLGKKVNSYNGAYSSSTSFHGLNMLINKVLPYKPDYLVFMYNSVDIIKLRLSPNFYWENNYIVAGGTTVDVLRNIKNRLFPNIYYVLNTNLDFNIGASVQKILNFFGVSIKKVNNTQKIKTFKNLNSEAIKDVYAKNLKAIIEICKIYGITPVILTEPYNLKEIKLDKDLNKLGVTEFITYHDDFNEIIRNFDKDDSVILVDLYEYMKDSRQGLFIDKYHYSVDGVAAVSNYITDKIAKNYKQKIEK
jgi:hypothetical protein